MSINIVDLAIVVILAYFVATGLRRGFLAGGMDLVGMAVAFVFAIKTYPYVTGV